MKNSVFYDIPADEVPSKAVLAALLELQCRPIQPDQDHEPEGI